MIPVLERLSDGEKEKLAREDLPTELSPMLAVLVDDAFSGPDWIFERKLDGERALCFHDGEEARLLSRNGKNLAGSYPEIVEALETLSPFAWVGDGEIVAFEDDVTSFSRLQERMQVSNPEKARGNPVAVYYYLFDIPHLSGRNLTSLPLRIRKIILRDALRFSDPIRFTPHRNEAGEAYFRDACRKGWEGIMAKRADSPYITGRSRKWLKFKCVARQELVIGGFTDPGGRRKGFGALLVGYYDEGDLRYAGKVGTGFDEDQLVRLSRRLKRLERKTPPFCSNDREDLPGNGVHWVTPKLVADFGFSEWTPAGKLRHPRFLGLRRDKDPDKVSRERPEAGEGP